MMIIFIEIQMTVRESSVLNWFEIPFQFLLFQLSDGCSTRLRVSVQQSSRRLLLLDQGIFGNALIVRLGRPTVLRGFALQKSRGGLLFGNGEETTQGWIPFDERLSEEIVASSDGERFFEKDARCHRIEKEIQCVIQVPNGQGDETKADVDDVHFEIQLVAADRRGEQPVPTDLIGHREGDECEGNGDQHHTDMNASRSSRSNAISQLVDGNDRQRQDQDRRENVDEEDLNRSDDLIGFREEETTVVDRGRDHGQA